MMMFSKDDRDAILRAKYAGEPWGKLAIEAGFDPVNTESQARSAFQFCAEKIEELKDIERQEWSGIIERKTMHAKFL